MTRRGGLAALAGLIALWLLVPAAAQDDGRYRDGIAAEVNGDPVTRHEVEVFSRLSARYRQILQRAGASPALEDERKRFLKEQLETLIEERVLLQEGVKQKLSLAKDDERRIERELERQAVLHGGVEGLKRTLEQHGVPYDYYVERKRANLLIGKLLLKNVSREIFVPPEQIRRYFKEHPEKFARAGRIVLRQLLIYDDASPAVAMRVPKPIQDLAKDGWGRQKALALATRLRGLALAPGGDFAALAREWSMTDDAEKGGLHVFGESIDLLDPVGRVAGALKAGEVSEPIASRIGVHLVQMVERRAPGTLAFAEVQRDIENRLKGEAWQERLKVWVKKLKDEAIVSVYLAPE